MATASSLGQGGRLVALRLHARHAAPGTPQAESVASLLDLGQREAGRQAEGRIVEELVAAVHRAIGAVPAQVAARLDEVAAIAVELGLGVAREIVGAALDKGLVDPTPTVVRCLRDCVHGTERTDLVVRLHPADLALVAARLADHAELADEVARARFVADKAVPRGGVCAETDAGRLRYDPADALERVAAEVRREVAS